MAAGARLAGVELAEVGATAAALLGLHSPRRAALGGILER